MKVDLFVKILHLSDDGLPDWRVEKAAHSAFKKGHEVMFAGGKLLNFNNKLFSKIFEINWNSRARSGFPFEWNEVKKRIKMIISESKPDIVHTHNLFSAKMACELKLPFIYDDHEFWSKHSLIVAEIHKIFLKDNPRYKKFLDLYFRIKRTLLDKRIAYLWSRWEKEIVSNHPTITVSEKIATELAVIGNNANEIVVVQNYPTLLEVKDLPAPLFHNKLSSVYAGNDGISMGKIPNRNIEGLFTIFEQEEVGDLAVLGWEGNSSSSKISYHGLLQRNHMYSEMCNHSIGLLPWKKHWSHYFLNPNKPYEYAHGGLLVLCTSDLFTVSDTLKENCVTFENYNDLSTKLKYYNDNPEDLYKRRIKSFDFARRNLIWEKIENNIFSAYKMC